MSPTPKRLWELKHSGYGILSFILAALAGLMEIYFLAVSRSRPFEQTDPGEQFLMAAVLMGGNAVNLLGVLLGIVGIFQRRRNRIFAFLGLGINCLILLAMIGLFILGGLVKKYDVKHGQISSRGNIQAHSTMVAF
jgi:hypothetical protein